jgi:hypothetical protein
MRAAPALAIALLAAAPAVAADPRFAWPVDCRLGTDCFIQQYVDADPGPGRADFRCGILSYDGHDGTDIRALDLAAMEAGVAVLAAAAGTVKATRDGEPDMIGDERGAAAIGGREAGNGVVIDHGGGWETQYSHLKRGSVAVRPGDPVDAGMPLGEIGLSGNTEFPHVEFSVRHDGQDIDPFTGLPPGSGCEATGSPLWIAVPAYRPTGLLAAGFATEVAEAAIARDGGYADVAPTTDQPLVLWADLFGVAAGDVQTIVIAGPDGGEVYRDSRPLEAAKVLWFAFGGKRPPDGGWKPGDYTATYRLERDGAVVAEATRSIELK